MPAYLELAETLGLQRMVVVQASIYGTDNAVTLDAIERSGRYRARGVAVINDSLDEPTLRKLVAAAPERRSVSCGRFFGGLAR